MAEEKARQAELLNTTTANLTALNTATDLYNEAFNVCPFAKEERLLYLYQFGEIKLKLKKYDEARAAYGEIIKINSITRGAIECEPLCRFWVH